MVEEGKCQKRKKTGELWKINFYQLSSFMVAWQVSRSLLTTAIQMNHKKDKSVPLVSIQSYSAPIKEYKNKTHHQDQTKTVAADKSLDDQFMQ